jgi:hypothetical protein
MATEIPKSCSAGCVVNPGSDFKVVMDEVPVPEPGAYLYGHFSLIFGMIVFCDPADRLVNEQRRR